MNAQTKELQEKINKYLTKQFVCPIDDTVPDDECLNEARWILQACEDTGMVFMSNGFYSDLMTPIDLTEEAHHD